MAAPTPSLNAEALWQFAVKVYGAPDMQPSLLGMQDHFGLDVCVVLWALWQVHQSAPVDVQIIRDARRRVSNWREDTVLCIRRARQVISQPGAALSEADRQALRSHLLAAELVAERGELNLLADIAVAGQKSGADGASSQTAEAVLDQVFLAHGVDPKQAHAVDLIRKCTNAFLPIVF